MDHFEEAEFLKEYGKNPERAFRRLMDGFRDRVYLFCLRAASRSDDAEDLAQEVFIRVWKGLGRFRGESSLATWIYRIAWNVCASYLDKKGRSPLTQPILEEVEEETGAGLVISDDDAGIKSFEDRQFLQTLFEALPEAYKLGLTLFYMQEQSYEEIATVTGWPMGTVKANLHRAKARLKAAALAELKPPAP